MNQPYLLTYKTEEGFLSYAWFYDEEEMDEFISSENVLVLEAFYITGVEKLDK